MEWPTPFIAICTAMQAMILYYDVLQNLKIVRPFGTIK